MKAYFAAGVLIRAGMRQNKLPQKFKGGALSFDEYRVSIELRHR